MVVVDGVEMVDVQEASRIVHRTPETIRRWVWSGRVRSIKQGNRLLVPRADLDDDALASGDASTAPLSLREWAARVATRTGGSPGVSARDLIQESRTERDARAGR